MTRIRPLLVVGAGLAGAQAAAGARRAGYDGRITIVGDEPHLPYQRPPLSKAVLRGQADAESTRLHEDSFYADNAVELVTGDRVLALDLETRRACLDTVVLATGASPRRLDVPGSRLSGVHYLRTVDDAVRLRDSITTSRRVAVVGAGWIGSEVTASARQLGLEVVLIDPAPTPLHRVLGTDVGSVFRQLHADHGVDLRLGVGVTELQSDGSVQKVVLTDGGVEPADVVVVAVGVLPRVELATAAGLAVGNAVIVDDRLQASVPGVYAAGDVADAWHPRYQRHLRVEHWATAFGQGAVAGANASGRSEPYTELPSFYSEQYDLGLAYVGHADPDDRFTVRGDLTERQFIGFFHRDGVVSAAMAVNMWDAVDDLKALVAAAQPTDPSRLEDPGTPVRELTAKHR